MKTLAQIGAQLQGYDPQALKASDVNAFLARLVEPVTETETLGIFAALDRVLAADVVSPISVPPHDNSAMDGYALAGAQLQPTQPLTLKVVGTALAGKAWQGNVGASECLKIMTGAVLPAGLDTVVPQELVTVGAQPQLDPQPDPHPSPLPLAGEGAIPEAFITIPPNLLQRGDNRRLLGEDLMAGQVALRRGTRLSPAALGLLASLGLASVPVYRRLRVAYFSTGDEILSLGQPPREGAVYDSNRYTVFGLLTRLGCEVIDLGVVPDQPALLEQAFTQAAARADAIITSGGVSVGEADHTKAMMKQLGDVAFWRIAMRPGRPMAVGRISAMSEARFAAGPPQGETAPSGGSEPHAAGSVGAILFGLPGNPVAVMVTFIAFVRPALLQMMGCTAAPPPPLRAKSLDAIRKKPGRTEYQRASVSSAPDGSPQVRLTGNQGSGVLSSMVEGNGLIVLHHAQGNVAVGDEVDVLLFDGAI